MVEFIVMLAFALLFGSLTLAVAFNLLADTSERQRLAALNDVGYLVQDELILAATVDDGYQRIITIPSNANRFAYNLSTDADGESISIASAQTMLTFDIPRIDGELHNGANFRITKNGTVIVVEVVG